MQATGTQLIASSDALELEHALPGPATQVRRCFSRERRALPVTWFRGLVGAALCAHCMRHQYESAALLRSGMLAAAPGSLLARLLSAGVPAEVWFGCGALLALGIALGVRPKLCALLLLGLSIGTQRTLAPVARLDDWIGVVMPWWLLLLPDTPGVVTALGDSTEARAARVQLTRGTVSGWTVGLLAAHVLASYFWLNGFRALSPAWRELPWLSLSLGLLPGLYLLPLGPLRWLAPPLQVALHAWTALLSGEWLTHAVLAASCLLLFGDLQPAPPAAGRSAAQKPVDAAFVLAASYTLVLLLAALGSTLGLQTAAQRSRQLLADLGLAPLRADQPLPASTAWFQEANGALHAWSEVDTLPDPQPVRARLLLGQLLARSRGARSAQTEALSDQALHALARGYCAQRSPRAPHARSEVRLVVDGANRAGLITIASFDCQSRQDAARFLPTGG
jgi:hypothetical protein